MMSVYELRGAELIRIDAPTDASVSVHRNWLLIELRSDWYTGSAEYVAGSLLAADYDEFLSGTAQLQVVFEPDPHTCLNTTRGRATSSWWSHSPMWPAASRSSPRDLAGANRVGHAGSTPTP